MQHGGSVPASVAVLLAAEDWGCPPWEIAGGNKYHWFMRWSFYKEQLNKKRERDSKHRSKR